MSEVFSYKESGGYELTAEVLEGRILVSIDIRCCGDHGVTLPPEQVSALIEWLQEQQNRD